MDNIVLGIDIGTSSVKTIAVNQQGTVLASVSEPLTIEHQQSGYSEQHPDAWVAATKANIRKLVDDPSIDHTKIEGISFSGQMHSLVILDESHRPLRNAILWNDTRSTPQCETIKAQLGDYVLDNPVLEGFTLTKMLWVQQNEPDLWHKVSVFLLPKDYVRFALTGELHMEYADASSTLLLDPDTKTWDKSIGEQFGIHDIYPELVSSQQCVGTIKPNVADELGLNNHVAVFAGGGDNAAGAVGAGVIRNGEALCSIGTSGVFLICDDEHETTYRRNIHLFQHSVDDMSYAMAVTLAAGDSLSWFKQTVLPDTSFSNIVELASRSTIGARGLVFTPYLSGERTPHGDASIRGSFIGLSHLHTSADLARAVIEGITYSLYDAVEYIRSLGKDVSHIVSIGGGAKSEFWLQLQADVFNTHVSKLKYEEGPSMGAAMIAAKGVGWFESIESCVNTWIEYDKSFTPNQANHDNYMRYFDIYQSVYEHTQPLTKQLLQLSTAQHSEV
ncbi:D-xylulose kinase [Staphylococcus auricularis]|uniref:Xylulose kinase n=1 Tax=Staphylococcus auricularis TaxID=29379 RepID=A0AAP8PMW7_9STAP|nr:xylulokinase [Staphylococcus auricularis]MDC6327129.1 xylulokinase [Staphylococcus auricularis]MDN4533161.1 xylulokinase [Staphylococcus auricularis]MDN4533337.1 xylulokinase [Staphylococcus auricularis]PNZ66382.1 xylulokinase [Staphylococcus auricularis]QPT06229.1 xylulokinase [Staphylococcus auricularis]